MSDVPDLAYDVINNWFFGWWSKFLRHPIRLILRKEAVYDKRYDKRESYENNHKILPATYDG
jgi:hypothetical protein